MSDTFNMIKDEIKDYIQTVDNQGKNDAFQKAEYILNFITKKFHEIKEKFEAKTFDHPSTEIFYYKNVKCHLLALIQHHFAIQQIEFSKPNLDNEYIIKFYQKELNDTKKTLFKYNPYYKYFKTKQTHLDDHYFRQVNSEMQISNGKYLVDIENRPHSPCMHIFSLVESSEMTRIYLMNSIMQLKNESLQNAPVSLPKNLKWTTSKTDLIELIYAIHAVGSFNNGKADLKEIAQYFQYMFQVDLGQYNRVFYDIRARKNNRTKFLDSLQEALLKRMKDTDNELFI